MKVSVELYGAAREFSNKAHLDFELVENSSIKDLRNQMIEFVDLNFKGNKTFKNACKMVDKHRHLDGMDQTVDFGENMSRILEAAKENEGWFGAIWENKKESLEAENQEMLLRKEQLNGEICNRRALKTIRVVIDVTWHER